MSDEDQADGCVEGREEMIQVHGDAFEQEPFVLRQLVHQSAFCPE
jgi:hypothetical protein